jgi:hypothetical protein
MRHVIAIAAAFATLAAGTAASARMSDAQYLAANRCRALVAAPSLGAAADVGAVDRKLRDESRGRDPIIQDRAEQLREQAQQEASHPNDVVKARLQAERDGVCHDLLS